MRNFQDTFETLKQSFISAFLICMTVPLINLFFLRLYFSMLVKPFLLKKHNVYVTIAPQHSIMKSSLPSVIFSFPTKVLSFGNFGSPELLRRSSLICLLRATIVTCCVFTLCIYEILKHEGSILISCQCLVYPVKGLILFFCLLHVEP